MCRQAPTECGSPAATKSVFMNSETSLIRIRSRRLAIDIARPGTRYTGARFDWSSFVNQVTLDDTHTFCGSEGTSEANGGAGLCCEFAPATAVAFAQAAPGERFVKPGVGLLTRPDAASYKFFSPYAVEPFEMSTQTTANSVTFTIEPRPCNGYAMRVIRRLTVDDNRLRMTVLLENTGTQPIATEEYCHNFIAINGQGPGPGLALTTGFKFAHKDARQVVNIQQNIARWESCPQRAFYLPGNHLQRSPGTYWMLKHEPSGVGMAESGTFPLNRFTLWGCGHVVSPEVFVAVHARPGDSQCWHRDFTFFGPGDTEPIVALDEPRPRSQQDSSVASPHSAPRKTPVRA